MIMVCERCGKRTAKTEVCNYCNKRICLACVKSGKKIKKIKRLFICKSCWTNIESRKRFKSEGVPAHRSFS